MAKQRQARLSKADISKIVDRAISETLEEQADQALCKAYREYLIDKIDTLCQENLAMIHELKQHAKTDKERERFDYMSRMQVNLHQWIGQYILRAYYDFVIDED